MISITKEKFNDIRGNVSKIQVEQEIALKALWLSGWLIVAVLLFIIGYICYHGLPTALSLNYLFAPPQGGRYDTGGILYQIIATIYLVFGSILVAAPIGISAAIYLTEYAPQNFLTRLIRFAIENFVVHTQSDI